MKYQNTAKKFTKAIVALAKNEDALDNLELYLANHFDVWMQKFASTPEKMTEELNSFAHIYDGEKVNE